MAQSHGIFQPPFDRVENHSSAPRNEVRDPKDYAPLDLHASGAVHCAFFQGHCAMRAPTSGDILNTGNSRLDGCGPSIVRNDSSHGWQAMSVSEEIRIARN
jgi:hypothetical protein